MKIILDDGTDINFGENSPYRAKIHSYLKKIIRSTTGTGMGMNNARWTEAEILLLRQLHSDNVPLKDIAKQMNRTISGIYSRIHILGLHQKAVKASQVIEI